MTDKRIVFSFVGLMFSTVSMSEWGDAWALGAAWIVIGGVSRRGYGRELARRLRPFIFFAVIAFVFGGISYERPVFSLGWLKWGEHALKRATFMALRLIGIGLAAGWTAIHVGTVALVSQFVRGSPWGKKAGQKLAPLFVGITIGTAFLPMLQQEATALRMSWRARAGGTHGYGIVGSLRYALSMMIPLLAATLRRAEAMAITLDMRMAAAGKKDGLLEWYGNTNASPGGLRASNGVESSSIKGSIVIVAAWIPFVVSVIRRLV